MLKSLISIISMAVFTEGFNQIHRPIVPLKQIIYQSPKSIPLSKNTRSYDDSKSDRDDKTRNFHSTAGSIVQPSLKNMHQEALRNLQNSVENANRDSLYIAGINQMNNITLPKVSRVSSNKMIFRTRTSNGSGSSKLLPNEPKNRDYSYLIAPANLYASYSQLGINPKNNFPYLGPQKQSVEKIERSTLNKEPRRSSVSADSLVQSLREDNMPHKRIHWHIKGAINPHHANNHPSKSNLEDILSSERRFNIDYDGSTGKSSLPEFKRNTQPKSNYRSVESIKQFSRRLQPYQSESFSNEDNNSEYSDASSSQEFQNPKHGSFQSVQNFKSPQTELKMQLPKYSYFNIEQGVKHSRPSFQLSPSFESPKNSDSRLHVKQELHSEGPHRFPLHQKGFSTPSLATSANSNNHLTEKSVLNPIQPSFRTSHQEHLQNSHSKNPQYFNSAGSSDRTLSQFSGSSEISVDHRPPSDEYISFDLIGKNLPHYQARHRYYPFISSKSQFQSHLPNHEHQHDSDSNQSEENAYLPRHTDTHIKNDKRKDLKPNYKHNKYSSDEDILAAKVKALLNPSEIPTAKDSPFSGNNLSSQGNSLPLINHHLTNVDTERDMYIKNSTVSERGGDIVGLGSDPEPDSEPESEDNKGGYSEEEHDGFLDMGAYTDKQGSFGWYADFPVGRGHDKVSYSSS